MFNLQDRIKGIDKDRDYVRNRTAVRDVLLQKEWADLVTRVKEIASCHLSQVEAGKLHELKLTVTPMAGDYIGGRFQFTISIPHEYNIAPPAVKCLTRIWHPNINEDGAVCLSILRPNSLDGYGWAPSRKVIDVVMGLDSLFTDLIDFEDPLNREAAEMHQKNRDQYREKVKDYIRRYASGR